MTREQEGSHSEDHTAREAHTWADVEAVRAPNRTRSWDDVEAERGDPRGTPEYEAAERRMDFGRIVRAQREAGGLSQGELAQRVGTTSERIQRLERGGYNLPSIEALTPVLHAIFTRKGGKQRQ